MKTERKTIFASDEGFDSAQEWLLAYKAGLTEHTCFGMIKWAREFYVDDGKIEDSAFDIPSRDDAGDGVLGIDFVFLHE